MTPHDRSPATDHVSRWQVAVAVLRIFATTTLLVSLYALAPLEIPDDRGAAGRLVLSVLVLIAVVTWQILAVARSPHPRARGVEAVSVSFPLLIFLFASTYFAMDQANPGSFNETLSRADAAYLTVTILSTVGFGDIVPTTEASRMVVTCQMVVNMILIGVVAKVLLNTVRQRRAVLAGMTAQDAAREPLDPLA
jgi:hypothetical protein